jgi:SOS response associated peptidase (SRAP)
MFVISEAEAARSAPPTSSAASSRLLSNSASCSLALRTMRRRGSACGQSRAAASAQAAARDQTASSQSQLTALGPPLGRTDCLFVRDRRGNYPADVRPLRQLPARRSHRAHLGTRNPLPNLAPSWNVAPTQDAAVVRRHPETGERHLDLLKWGLRPYWTRAPSKAQRPSTRARRQRPGCAYSVTRCHADAAWCRRCRLRAEGDRGWQAAVCHCTPRRSAHSPSLACGKALGDRTRP